MKILITSLKGGCGKTSLAVALAAALGDTFVADCDRQLSATDWASRGNLPFQVGTIAAAIASECQHIIIYSEARLSPSELRNAVAAASLTLIPCQASALDLASTARFFEQVRPLAKHSRLMAVLTMLHPAANAARWFSAAPGIPWAKTVVRRRAAWPVAALRGCTLREVSGAGARRAEGEIKALLREVIQ